MDAMKHTITYAPQPVTETDMKVSGWTGMTPMNSDMDALIYSWKDAIQSYSTKSGSNTVFTEFTPLSFRSQIEDPTNYTVVVRISATITI